MCISVSERSLFTKSVALAIVARITITSSVMLRAVATTLMTGTIARVPANTVEEIVICFAVVLFSFPGRMAFFLLG